MRGKSVSLRLVAAAAICIAAALILTGAGLIAIFRDHVEKTFDASLYDHAEEILALAEPDPAGAVALRRHPADPRFNRPLSGWYWEVGSGGGRPLRSRSLWDQTLALPADAGGDRAASFLLTGPRGESLRAVARAFTLPGVGTPFTILVAGPAAQVDAAVSRFAGMVAAALAVLGLGLVGAVVLQVRYGLKPLARMRAALADIRAGRQARLEGPFPAEIEPLADELNALLEHDAAVIARARTQAGDLAHALKTPLAVLTNEADRLDGGAAELIRAQCALMGAQVERHLSRARLAATRGVLGARVELAPVLESLSRTMAHIHAARGLEIAVDGDPGLAFAGDRQDLDEALGNLMDNACKWAAARVRVHAVRSPGAGTGDLAVSIEDDGPGIPVDSLAAVTDRGHRLDEGTPGSGLGLAIVRDIAEAYGGSLVLAPSSLGGLSATLRLPAG